MGYSNHCNSNGHDSCLFLNHKQQLWPRVGWQTITTNKSWYLPDAAWFAVVEAMNATNQQIELTINGKSSTLLLSLSLLSLSLLSILSFLYCHCCCGHCSCRHYCHCYYGHCLLVIVVIVMVVNVTDVTVIVVIIVIVVIVIFVIRAEMRPGIRPNAGYETGAA